MSRFVQHTAPLVTFLACALVVIGCENTIDPIAENGSNTFAIHGYLDMRSSNQKVRIEMLRPTILSDPIPLNGVEVSTIDASDGSHQIWRDSSLVLDNGQPGVVFVSDFRPQLGHKYSLLISKNGIVHAEAEAQLPASPEIRQIAAVGDSLNLVQSTVLVGIFNKPTAVYLRYEVIPPDDSGVKTVRIAYGEPGAASSTGWTFGISLSNDRYIILNSLGLNVNTKGVKIRSVSFELVLFSEEWAKPTDESNLTNAHGFFGSVGLVEHYWTLDSQTLSTMGFLDGQIRN